MATSETTQGWLWFCVAIVKAVAWPFVVAIAFWRLKPLLAILLKGRTIQLEGFGVKATVSAVEQQQAASESPAAQRLAPVESPLPPTINRPALDQMEQEIRTAIATLPEDAREPTMVRALAISRLIGAHEYIYNRIFGSQIAGLRRLDEGGPVTIQKTREFFGVYEKQYPAIYENYGFDGWLGFMTSNLLVTRTADRLEASKYGHDFLVYLREARLTDAKAG